MNEARLRELHHRVTIPISGGLVVTANGKHKEIISATITTCCCLGQNWERGPCQTLEAIEDDSEMYDIVDLVTWGGGVIGQISLPLGEVYHGD